MIICHSKNIIQNNFYKISPGKEGSLDMIQTRFIGFTTQRQWQPCNQCLNTASKRSYHFFTKSVQFFLKMELLVKEKSLGISMIKSRLESRVYHRVCDKSLHILENRTRRDGVCWLRSTMQTLSKRKTQKNGQKTIENKSALNQRQGGKPFVKLRWGFWKGQFICVVLLLNGPLCPVQNLCLYELLIFNTFGLFLC